MQHIDSVPPKVYAQMKGQLANLQQTKSRFLDDTGHYVPHAHFVLKALSELEYPEKLINGINEVIANLAKSQEDHPPESHISDHLPESLGKAEFDLITRFQEMAQTPKKENHPLENQVSDDILESLEKAQKAIELMFQKVVLTLEKKGFNIVSGRDLARMTNPGLKDKLQCITEKTGTDHTLILLFCAYINQPYNVVKKLFEFYRTELTSPEQLHTIPNFQRSAVERGLKAGQRDPNYNANRSPTGKVLSAAYSGRTPGQAAKAGMVNGG